MKKSIVYSVFLFLVPMFMGGAWAHDRPVVRPFAAIPFVKLPKDLPFPEGITANPYNGDIYVGNFNGGATNSLLRFSRHGKLEARKDFPGVTPLLGLAFNPKDKKVYICSLGDFIPGDESKILRIDGGFDATTSIEDVVVIPRVGAPGPRTVVNPDTNPPAFPSEDVITFGNNARVPNDLTFNYNGDLFVSDSFQGAIFRINKAKTCKIPGPPCAVDTVAHDGLLATAGFPPFGANGVAFNRYDDSVLFVANTGDDRILKVDVDTGSVSIFAESINGADGIAFDHHGTLWVAANQADQVVGLNRGGLVVAELGEFLGIRHNGSARGLIFPASFVIVGHKIFVTNLALPLTADVMGDEWEEKVTRYTVSRIRIPGRLKH